MSKKHNHVDKDVNPPSSEKEVNGQGPPPANCHAQPESDGKVGDQIKREPTVGTSEAVVPTAGSQGLKDDEKKDIPVFPNEKNPQANLIDDDNGPMFCNLFGKAPANPFKLAGKGEGHPRETDNLPSGYFMLTMCYPVVSNP